MMSWEDRTDRMAEMAEMQPVYDVVEDKNRTVRFLRGLISGLILVGMIYGVSYLFWWEAAR